MALEFFDELEAMPPEEREKYLNEKLSETIEHAYRSAPAAKELLDKAGVSPSEIRSIKDLEKLPITRKADLIELQRKNLPYGGLLAIPPEEVERIFISPGPIYEPHQNSKIKWFAKAFWAAGFRKGDIIINSFTYHLSPAGILFHEAIRDCGATAIPMGTGNTETQIKTIFELKVTGFVGTPSFLMTIIKKAEEMGYDPRKDFSLKKAWFTGEMLPPSLRQTFEESYHISTYQTYAVTEPGGAIAYECKEKQGMHLMDDYVVEIVNPETGEQLGPGEVGEIVVTPIHNPTWGLIRFGTGDMSSYTTEPCPCGRTANRLMGIVGRTSDAVKVRGMFLVSKQVEQLFSEIKEISNFQVIVSRPAERDELTLRVELEDEALDREKVAQSINQRFQQTCRMRIDKVEFLNKGTIAEERQTIVDERRWD